MVSFSDGAMSADAAAHYHQIHYSAAGYYAGTEQGIIGHAVGKGAEFLALSELRADQFNALLCGQDPATQSMLRPEVTHGDVNRAGWDCTLSPPKSISIQALVCGDQRLIDADRAAALYAINEVESCALARRRGGKEWIQTANVVAVMFEHHDARESARGQHGPMPQLHHHFFLMNLTRLASGEWRSLDPQQIYKARRFIDAVYMGELAKQVQQLGYTIVRKADGAFELAHFTRTQIEAFSERAVDIEQTKAARGITDPRAARSIVMETRKAKREHDPAIVRAERVALAEAEGIELGFRPSSPQLTPVHVPASEARQSLDFAHRHLSAKFAVIDHRALVADALKHGVGVTDLDHVRAEIGADQKSGQLIAAGKSYLHPLDTYTSPRMVRLERENLALIRDQMGQGRPIAGIMMRSAVDGSIAVAGTDRVRQWAVQRKLLPDQIDAAVLTLTTPQWASAIEGLAGSAKTSLVGVLREYIEANGWTVRGFGVTTGSVKALQDAGINAQTIAKTLAAASLPPKRGPELWVIDESSLLATPPTNRLLKAARHLGVERIVFVGDQKQHLAIEAGSPVRQFLADHMAVAQLTTIRRQQDPELRRAVELAANGQTSAAIDLLDQQKRVVQVPDFAARYERIANDYLDAYEARQRCLVVSPGNDERRALNQAIRTTLISHGYVNPRGHDHQVLINRDLSPAQLQNPPSYHENDVVYFVRGSSKQGIPKKAYLTVAAVKEHSLTLRTKSGSSLDFNPARFKGLRVYTTETRTIAVGDRIQWREPDNPRRIANGESAVIKDLTHKHIEVAFDHGRQFRLPLDQTRHIDLGYATTSHASQGSTVDRVIINIDSKRNPDLVNQRQFYVSLSRPRAEARVYTDDAKAMRHAVARKQEKELALDVAQPKQTRTRGPSLGRR